ncbi:MAG: 2-oxoacid:acceptor oxidoreductase subunit alpha [candidate division Zixibacteria bacterium]|nr:2-oxoacid:acceptor oxidoreductase subunit alpha [candidate division Zixibacteria bacterium]MBU1469414.1 2-oxoacid:acceptor oxidoreductase subunit alpha [candidate division Zixibacteria bacterium]MBU2624168.1 2-oxoacid:acceptor oxidoreductase subunit alpha [candidate division Zixibacteria bacterium]
MKREVKLLQGNEACVEGAIMAGVRFFGGYPITPSTEIAEGMARRLPLIGGRFVQMEDEIASMASIIGASCAGVKSMTATSGPGFSLMQENLGYAYITETPTVIVDVQRGGPSTGLPTKVSQADTMQAGFGTHGDYYAIALAPSSVEEILYATIEAVNLSETYRTPVILLLDEVLAHMREKVEIPFPDEIQVVKRKRPTVPPDWYKHFAISATGVSAMAKFGDGYRFNITGLTHDELGFPTAVPSEIAAMLDKLKQKIVKNAELTCQFEYTEMDDDPNVAIFSYGIVARAAKQAVMMARDHRLKVGAIRPKAIWPLAANTLRKRLKKVRKLIVAELNQGQLINQIKHHVDRRHTEIIPLQRYDGELITPAQILQKVKEVKHHGTEI